MRTVLVVTCLVLLAASAAAGDDPISRFWEARRVMLAGDPASAAELFRTVFAADPKSDVADDCLYWMGRCYLRLKDKEPDAAVALNRLVREFPGSTFVPDAARELAAIGDATSVPVLRERGDAKSLAEFGEKAEERPAGPAAVPEESSRTADLAAEVEALKEEVKRLRQAVEEALELVKKLLAKRQETDK